MRSLGLAGIDLHIRLVGSENFKWRRASGRTRLHREREGLGMIGRRDLDILECARTADASAGEILRSLRRPGRHRVVRNVDRVRAEHHALGHRGIARERRIVGRTGIVYRRHRSFERRRRWSGSGIES
jgi:hypothetical protein